MAYATLLSITETLEFVLNPHHHQSPVPQQTGQQLQLLRSLHEKFTFLLSFMEEDFARTKSETMTHLETKIREMAFEAVHTIESQVSDGLHLRSEDLERIMEQVDSISAEVVTVKMKDLTVVKNDPPTRFSPVGSSRTKRIKKSPIVGFKDELMAIKERLFTPPPELSIISIVGMGGIGKTTLARAIFHDSKIVSRFDARGWLTVSQKYDVQDMLGHLLKSIERNGSNLNEVRELGERLYKSLKQKRYLIVMDDIWDIKAWDDVKRFFPRDNNGSRIILTTRLLDVAINTNSYSRVYRPSLLNLDDSWKLLSQEVFGEESCPRELEEIGKEIAKNCKGLPLALAVIGGLLSQREWKLDYWIYIQQNINSAIVDADTDFMEILALSYYNLPHQLRACFLYIGIFPEDFEVPKSSLIKLWIAEGFVKPHTSKSLEEVAHEYLQDLVDRNMILVLDSNPIGEIKRCGIHDLMRDLCTKITQEEQFLQVISKQLQCGDDIRASIPSVILDYYKALYNSQPRSLHVFRPLQIDYDVLYLSAILGFQRPRVLCAPENFELELPYDIATMRFLSVTKWGKFNLNASISKFFHLQTLIIHSTIVTLPVEIWNMPLKHIKTNMCFFPYPSGVTNVENYVLSKTMQTLKGLMNSSSTKVVLRLMPNLKQLRIILNRYIKGTKLSSYVLEYFVHLHQLEGLYIWFDGAQPYSLVEDFCLPSSLKKFILFGCCLSSKAMATIGSLPDLQVLRLHACHFVNKLWEPTEGQLDQLKWLSLSFTDLKHFKVDETSFPRLEYLRIWNCSDLERIPSSIGYIPTLRVFELRDDHNSSIQSEKLLKSAKLLLKEQEDMGNENLEIILITPTRYEDEDDDEEDNNEAGDKEDAKDEESDDAMEDDWQDDDDEKGKNDNGEDKDDQENKKVEDVGNKMKG